MYMPIFFLVFSSFMHNGEFSLVWYKSLLCKKDIVNAISHSLKIAYISASIATALGTILAVTIKNRNSAIGKMAVTPLFIPEALLGLSLLVLFNFLFYFHIYLSGFYRIIIAHVTIATAYSTTIIKSGLAGMEPIIEEAAMDLGARPMKVFFAIILPLIFRFVLSAWILSFILSLDDIVLVTFVSTSDITTLPMMIFSTIRMGISPEINALSTIIMSFVACTGLFLWLFLNKYFKRNKKL